MSSLEHMSIAQAQALGEEKVKNLMKENANQQLSSMSIGKAESMGTKKVNDLLNISNGSYFGEELETSEDEEEEPTIINNVVSGSKELINRYGVRQDIVIKNNKEDPLIKARRILSDNAKPKEEITVQCIGDLDYRIGFGVHMYLPFLPKYYDCLMYVKEVEHEWIKGGFFTSELTLTPSRVMDEQEWSDIEEDDENSNESGGQVIEKAVTWALDICNDNSHGYSQPRRWSGIDFDCSSFVISAFEQAGVQLKENGANSTSDLKQACLKCGFEVVEGWDKTTAVGLQKGDILLNEASHTCLYIGDGKVANCSSDRGHPETGDQDGTEIQVQNFYVYHNGWNCALRYIEVSSEESGGDYSGIGIPEDYLSVIKSGVESNVNTFIRNMDNYGYKNNLITICKQNNIDPYTMAGIITIESEGNPVCGTGSYKGLCQTSNGSTDPATNIKQGCQEYNQKCSATGYSSVWVSLSAYNSGEGTVINSCKAKGYDLKTVTLKQLGDALYDYVSSNNPTWNADEKKYYASKVILAIKILKEKKVLS